MYPSSFGVFVFSTLIFDAIAFRFHRHTDVSLYYAFDDDRVFATRSLLECVKTCGQTSACVYGQYDNHECRLPALDYAIVDTNAKEGSVVFVRSECLFWFIEKCGRFVHLLKSGYFVANYSGKV